MYGVERAELSRHGLRGTIEDETVDLDELQRVDQRKDGGAATGHFDVRKNRAQSQAIQGTQALSGNESARNTSIDVPPLGECIRLAERDA